MKVTPLKNGLFDVASSSTDLSYIIKPGVSCTCPDHSYRGRFCKHLRAVEEFLATQAPADGLQAKAATLTDAELAAVEQKYAGILTAIHTEMHRRAQVAPPIGRSVKTWGPRSEAEAFA